GTGQHVQRDGTAAVLLLAVLGLQRRDHGDAGDQDHADPEDRRDVRGLEQAAPVDVDGEDHTATASRAGSPTVGCSQIDPSGPTGLALFARHRKKAPMTMTTLTTMTPNALPPSRSMTA